MFATATDPGLDKPRRAIEVAFSLTNGCTGLKRGLLNLPSAWKLTGWGKADSISSDLSEFAVLHVCLLRPNDMILFLESKLTLTSQVASRQRFRANST